MRTPKLRLRTPKLRFGLPIPKRSHPSAKTSRAKSLRKNVNFALKIEALEGQKVSLWIIELSALALAALMGWRWLGMRARGLKARDSYGATALNTYTVIHV